jgi:predicted regulator of Ras-like GTPase activity (Roadblock/LC7/MglB family)
VSFDAATAWVGEYSGVRMALVADEDGLVVSRWSRQTYSQDEEYWAAVAVEMVRFHQRQPGGVGTLDLRRLEVETASGRLTIRRAGLFWLAVLTEAEAGDLVSVRIVQAVEMIEKHYHDRYRAVRPAGLEVAHVSSAAGAEQNVGHYRQHAGSR